MIVTCPNCETRYNLPDDKVPAGGAKVKCSKCAQVFKAEHPSATPEEEVEALLEEEGQGGDTQAGDDFDETFEDVAARSAGAESESSVEEGVEKSADEPEEDMFAGSEDGAEDDLFGEPTDTADDELPDTEGLFDESEDETSVFEEEVTPSEPETDDSADDSIFEDIGEDENEDEEEDDGGLFDEDEEPDDLFADTDEEEGDEDEEQRGSVFDDDDLSLDAPEKKGGRSLGCLIILLVAVLVVGAAVYFKVWTYAGIDLADTLKNVPFVGQMFMEETGGEQEAAPGESPAERVRKIELKNVKQYYVPNEKVGNLFVVEGKAVNQFSSPKERIKVEVILYDATNNILTSQAFMCGNVLSQFQLQVQTEKEIKDGLSSEVGVLSNNTFIRPGASTPFMAVFFQPPTGVKEFMVKVVDVGDPE